MKILRNTKPLRVLIYEEIVKSIKAGAFKKDETLPNEIKLAQMLSVSRSSLREALLLLEEDGHLINKRGIGRIIAKDRKKELMLFDSNIEPISILVFKGMQFESKIVYEEIPSSFILKKLGLKGKVLVIEQNVLCEGKIIGYILNFIPLFMITKTKSKIYNKPVYELISKAIKISSVSMEFKATKVGESYGSKLCVKSSTPVLLIEETFHSEDGKPVLYLRNYLLTDEVSLKVDVPINMARYGQNEVI